MSCDQIKGKDGHLLIMDDVNEMLDRLKEVAEKGKAMQEKGEQRQKMVRISGQSAVVRPSKPGIRVGKVIEVDDKMLLITKLLNRGRGMFKILSDAEVRQLKGESP